MSPIKKKSTTDIYYEKNQNFMANRLVFLDFPSTVHTNFYGVIYTAISPVYITSVFCDMAMRIT